MCIRDSLKGTDKAEESLYMLGMSYYNQKDYQTAAQTFIQYYNVYPRGTLDVYKRQAQHIPVEFQRVRSTKALP